MDIEFILRGTSPLLCHNPQMVDPEFPINKAIREMTKKGAKKTDADLNEIKKLEWYGGIYTAAIGGRHVVTQPTSKVKKCLAGAAKITKQGKSIDRSIVTTALDVPLVYEGSEKAQDLDKELARLQQSAAFNSYLSVGVNGKRVMRTRPKFPQWGLIVPAIYIEDAGLNFDELCNIFALAGRAERIGDNRANGYGAFEDVVREVTPATKAIEPTLAGIDKFLETRARKAS